MDPQVWQAASCVNVMTIALELESRSVSTYNLDRTYEGGDVPVIISGEAQEERYTGCLRDRGHFGTSRDALRLP